MTKYYQCNMVATMRARVVIMSGCPSRPSICVTPLASASFDTFLSMEEMAWKSLTLHS